MASVEEQQEELPRVFDVSRQRRTGDSVAYQRPIFSILPDIYCHEPYPAICDHIQCLQAPAKWSPDLVPCETCWWERGWVALECEFTGHVNMNTIDSL